MKEWIEIGGNKIHSTVIIFDNVSMGTGNVFYPYSVIGAGGFMRDREPNGVIEIGDNNIFGNYSCVMVGQDSKTVIGNDNMIMNYVNVGHDVIIGDGNEIVAKTLICGHTTIGNLNKIKASVTIRNRRTIGDGNLIGMGSNVVKDIGSGERWFGNPAKLM